jgi:hypothetical protein
MDGIKEELVKRKERSNLKIELSKVLRREEVRQHLGLDTSKDEKNIRIRRFMGEL